MNSIEDGHICRPQIWRLRIFFSFVGGNPTLEIYKGERSPFPYKRGPLPVDLKKKKKKKKKKETMGLLYQKKCDPNGP